MRYHLTIEGMSCGHCVKHVEEALTELAGVSGVTVELQGGIATLEYDGNDAENLLKQAIEEAGYDLVSISNA